METQFSEEGYVSSGGVSKRQTVHLCTGHILTCSSSIGHSIVERHQEPGGKDRRYNREGERARQKLVVRQEGLTGKCKRKDDCNSMKECVLCPKVADSVLGISSKGQQTLVSKTLKQKWTIWGQWDIM